MPFLLLLGFTAALDLQKDSEIWRLRANLNGKYVEIYEKYKGKELIGTGLREIVERHNYYQPDREKKYAEILKPTYKGLYLVQERFVVGVPNDSKNNLLWMGTFKVDKNRLKLDKMFETPYVDLYGGTSSWIMGGNGVVENMNAANKSSDVFGVRSKVWTDKTPNIETLAKLNIGYQSGFNMSVDVMDRDFNVKFSVENLRNLPSRYGSSWRLQIDTNSIAPENLFLNSEGEPVSPNFPLVRDFSDGTIAVPVTTEFKRYIPILPNGTVKLEAIPTGGYYPDYAFSPKPTYMYQISGWIKEYLTSSGSLFGWANKELTFETGPLWKSIDWFDNDTIVQNAPTRSVIAQLTNGQWMMYSIEKSSQESIPHLPYFDTPFATRDELIRAYRPVYSKKVEPILAERRERARQEAIAYAKAYEEMTKYLEIDPSMSAGNMTMASLRSALYATVVSLNSRNYNDFNNSFRNLSGDYYLKYLAIAHNLRLVYVTEQQAKEYAASAKNEGIKRTFEALAVQIVREQEEAKKRLQELKRAKQAEMSNPNRFKPQPPASGPGWTSPWKDPYAQPSFADASRRHEQYMNDMWKYLGGQQAWRPYK